MSSHEQGKQMNFAELNCFDYFKTHPELQHLPAIEFNDALYLKPSEARNDEILARRKENMVDCSEEPKRSELLEMMYVVLADKAKWFGEDVSARRTSWYDDYINGADLYFECGGHILAVDVIVDADAEATREKTRRIKAEINSGEFSELKYVIFQDGTKHCVKNVPRIIIRKKREWVKEKAEIMGRNLMMIPGSNEELVTDPDRKADRENAQNQLASQAIKALSIFFETNLNSENTKSEIQRNLKSNLGAKLNGFFKDKGESSVYKICESFLRNPKMVNLKKYSETKNIIEALLFWLKKYEITFEKESSPGNNRRASRKSIFSDPSTVSLLADAANQMGFHF
ncbi:hypothetical protein C4569_03005 [Candidatus Parcubacteria bacterium]|nr:MAG: hypothetical protein C4569_03005 [Candidatus Parcubacteria bacterium]